MNVIKTNAGGPEQPNLTKEQLDAIIAQNMPKAKDLVYESMANERAAKEPIPSVINDAFIEDTIDVKLSSNNMLTIRKMKALDITLFKLMNSPFYQIIMGDIDENAMKNMILNEELMFLIIYQFTHDPKDIYKRIKKDKDKFIEDAILDIGGTHDAQDVGTLLSAILNHIGLVNKARADFVVPKTEEDEKTARGESIISDGEDKKKL